MLLTNTKIVLENEIIDGTLKIEDGVIKAIDTTRTFLPEAVDLEGAYVIPGLIELHTDNLDKFFTPRPKVDWPQHTAMRSHDALIISSGITTVLNAISIGDERDGGHRLQNLDKMLDGINYSQNNELNRANHLLHLRCELPSEFTLSLFEYLIEKEQVQLVSLMDHSPGQRQFVSLEKYREYYQGKYQFSLEDIQEYERKQMEKAAKYSHPNRHTIANLCREKGIALASHDDATSEHVEESALIGCTIAEFPTTVEAALASQASDISVLMGAPNIIRGGSHSGNVAAHALAEIDALDILSSDYYPASLLEAAVMLANDTQNRYALTDTIKMISTTPARQIGLDDRGLIAVGKRADLVAFHLHSHKQDRTEHAFIQDVWVGGKKVF